VLQLTTEDYFLSNRLGGVDDDNVIDAYQENVSRLGYTVYFNVQTEGQRTYIQYWMFYVFNPGSFNRHQGDWEMVQVVLDVNEQPLATIYSQHHSGVQARWSDVLVQDQTHPMVHVALGSHANYYRYYEGKLEGDHCDDDGIVLQPSDYALVGIQEDVPGGQPDTSWVWFGGKWGTVPDLLANVRGEAGPPGPMYREEGAMWDGAAFYEGARDFDTGTLWVKFLLYYATWIILGIVLFSVFFTFLRGYGKRKKGELRSPYLELLNIRGKDRRSIANMIALAGLIIAVIGMTYPVFTMEAWVVGGQYATGDYVTLFSLGGTDVLVLNTLDPNGDLLSLGTVTVNFALLLGSLVLLFVLSNIASTPKKNARRYMGFGVTIIFIFTMFFLAVLIMGDIVSYLAPSEEGGLVELVNYASQNPLGGTAIIQNPTFGQVEVRWGMDWGALLLPAGIALVGAGLLMRSVAKDGINE
jgi:hypothetical protein